MSIMTKTVAICGAGRISGFHARAFQRAGFEVVGFADPRVDAAAELAEGFGARGYPGLQSMLEAEAPDVVSIATPHDLHFPQAMQALSAGVDVFMDKPLALSPADGAELIAMAGSRGRVLSVNQNLLFHPAVERAREVLSTGALGRVVSAEAWSAGWLDIAPWDFRLDRARAGGGAWFDAGPHLVYTLAALVAPFQDLAAWPANGSSRLGGEDTAVATGRFEGGAVASMRISYAYTAPGSQHPWPTGWRQGFEINGTEGAVRLTVAPTGSFDVFHRGDADWVREPMDVDFSVTFDAAVADFARSREGGVARVPLSSSLRVLEWVHGAMSAWR